MANKLIINTNAKEHRIVLLNHGKIIEYHQESKNHPYNVGDIHLGTVKKIMPSLNAAFIDIGHEKDAFLHYLDLGENFLALQKFTKKANLKNTKQEFPKTPLLSPLKKEGNISQVLKKNEKILVQVAKEAISTKGVRLSSSIALAGRYLILMPCGDEINISKKITDKAERDRIKKLMLAIKPKNFSLIARTNAAGKPAAMLDHDLKNLCKKWEQGIKKLYKATPSQKIVKEVNRISSILRDLLNENFDQILVDDQATYKQVKEDVSRIDPKKEKIVQLYTGKTNLFEFLDLERQIQLAFSEIVNIEGGGYLIIEQTEAMYSIDVNSGSYVRNGNNSKYNTETNKQEDNALAVNLAAIKKAFPLFRLRNIGGVIVIDCISMQDPRNQEKLLQEAKKQAKNDNARIKILPLTEFGLLQVTRERTRPNPHLATKELCPTCRGTKKIQNALVISQQIEEQIHFLIKAKKSKHITLLLHPYLHSYFTKGIFSKQFKWFLRYHQWIKIMPEQSMPLVNYKFMNHKKELIAITPKTSIKALAES
ncbi:MAG: Rne/Rng family ribonuclease [Bacteroidota bacterium]